MTKKEIKIKLDEFEHTKKWPTLRHNKKLKFLNSRLKESKKNLEEEIDEINDLQRRFVVSLAN
jgi:hypothetical protein